MSTVDEKRRQSRAGAVSRAAVEKERGREVLTVNGQTVAITAGIEHGMVVVKGQRVHLGQETWETLRCGGEAALKGFLAAFCRPGVSAGLRYLGAADWWQEARIAEMQAFGAGVGGKDRLTLIEEELIRLVGVAQDFASSDEQIPAPHMQMFFDRLQVLRDTLDDAERRVGYLRGMMQLAEMALGEAVAGG